MLRPTRLASIRAEGANTYTSPKMPPRGNMILPLD
jgi:hypothetical protein